MSDDIVARLPKTCLTPSHESDLQVVHGLAAELRSIAHDHARDDGFVKFSGTRWLTYYHSLDRILMEHDRRQAKIYKSADEIERLRAERDEARQRVCEMHIHYSNAYRKVGSQIVQCKTVQEVAKAYRWNCYGEHDDLSN